MTTTTSARKGSAGGQARAISQREEALARYAANPRYCKYCKQPIAIKDGERISWVRKKVYCDAHCAGLANGARNSQARWEKHVWTHPVRRCGACGSECTGKLCRTCYYDQIRVMGQKSRAQVTRQAITKHAHAVMNGQERRCMVCGYDLHAEICHRRAVASFPLDTLLSVINAPSNLVYLCPNHHWELDRGRLQLAVAGDGVEPS